MMRYLRRWYYYIGLFLIYTIVFIGSVASVLLRAITAVMVQETMQSIFLVALLTTAFMIGRSISAFLTGFISDKVRRKNLLAFLGFSLLTLVNFSYLILPVEFYHFLRFLMGISSGIAWPMMQRLVLDFSPEKRRHRSTSVYFLLGWLGLTVGYYEFGRIPDEIALILAILLFVIITLLTLFLKPPESKIVTTKKTKRRKERKLIPPISTIVLLSLCFGISIGVISVDFLVGYLMIKFKTKIDVSNILTMASLFGFILSYFLGWSLDKYPKKSTVFASALLIPIGLFGFPFAETKEAMIADIAFIRASVSGFRPILIAQAKAEKKTGLRIGIINSVSNIATSIMLAFIGYVIELQLTLVIFIAIGMLCFCMIFAALLLWKT